MDFFGVVAMVWLLSAGSAVLVGRFRGRASDAMTLGVLFGPLGLALTILLIGRMVGGEEAVTVPIRNAQRPLQPAEDSRVELGRAA